MFTLKELLNDYLFFHSQYQQDYLITRRNGGTLYGQYLQSLREVYSRLHGLVSDWYNVEKKKNKIKRLETKKKQLLIDVRKIEDYVAKLPGLSSATKSLYPEFKGKTKTELQLDIESIRNKIEQLDIEIKFNLMSLEQDSRARDATFKELKRFFAQASWLKEKLEKKHGPLTEETKRMLDEDMWVYKIREMAAIDFIANRGISNVTYEFIHSSPNHIKAKILHKFKDVPDWYEAVNQNPELQIPSDIPMPTDQELLKLVGDSKNLLEALKLPRG